MTVEELIEELKRRNPHDRVGVSVRTEESDHCTAEVSQVQPGIDFLIIGEQ
jgi:hypothetical protein